MKRRFILTAYMTQVLARAIYDKLQDGTFVGRIPDCKGVIAFAPTLAECEEELRSTLEDWLLLGLKLGHPIPVIAGIGLNNHSRRETVEHRSYQELD